MTIKILLSYRRSDSGAMTGRLDDRLVERYGRACIFRDIDAIPAGTDFRAVIDESIRGCDAVLLVMGPNWIGPREDGSSRIMDTDDPVRAEVECAKNAGIKMIPVLVDNAVMVPASRLPESIKDISFLNAVPIDTGRNFHHDVERLIGTLDNFLLSRGKKLPNRQRGTQQPLQRRLLESLRKPATWWVFGSLTLPAAAIYAGIDHPPAQSARAAAAFAIAAQLLTLAIAVRYFAPAAARTLARATTLSLTLLAISGLGYFWGYSSFTYEMPITKERKTKGLVCTTDAALIYPEKCPALGTDELRTAEYKAERLWTVQSIAIANTLLLALWIAIFSSLTAVALCLAVPRS